MTQVTANLCVIQELQPRMRFARLGWTWDWDPQAVDGAQSVGALSSDYDLSFGFQVLSNDKRAAAEKKPVKGAARSDNGWGGATYRVD